MKLIDLLQGVNVALRVVQARLLTFVTLLLSFALAGWAAWRETPVTAMIALVWGLTIFLPVLYHDRGGRDVSETPHNAEGQAPSS